MEPENEVCSASSSLPKEVHDLAEKMYEFLSEQPGNSIDASVLENTWWLDKLKEIYEANDDSVKTGFDASMLLKILRQAKPLLFELDDADAPLRMSLSLDGFRRIFCKELASFLDSLPEKSFRLSSIVNTKAGTSERVAAAWKAYCEKCVESTESQPKLGETLKQSPELFEISFTFSEPNVQMVYLATVRAIERCNAFYDEVVKFLVNFLIKQPQGRDSVLLLKLVNSTDGEVGNEAVCQAWRAIQWQSKSGPRKLTQVLQACPEKFHLVDTPRQGQKAVSLTATVLQDRLFTEVTAYLESAPERSMPVAALFSYKTDQAIAAIWKALQQKWPKEQQKRATEMLKAMPDLFNVEGNCVCLHSSSAAPGDHVLESSSPNGSSVAASQSGLKNRFQPLIECDAESHSDDSLNDHCEENHVTDEGQEDLYRDAGVGTGPTEDKMCAEPGCQRGFACDVAVGSGDEAYSPNQIVVHAEGFFHKDVHEAQPQHSQTDACQLEVPATKVHNKSIFAPPPGLHRPPAAPQASIGQSLDTSGLRGETMASPARLHKLPDVDQQTIDGFLMEKARCRKYAKSLEVKLLQAQAENDLLQNENSFLKDSLRSLQIKQHHDQQVVDKLVKKLVLGSPLHSQNVNGCSPQPRRRVLDSTGSSGELELDSVADLQGPQAYTTHSLMPISFDPCACVAEPPAPSCELVKNPVPALLQVLGQHEDGEHWGIDDECYARMEEREAWESQVDMYNHETFEQSSAAGTDWSKMVRPRSDAAKDQLKLQQMLSSKCGKSFSTLLEAMKYIDHATFTREDVKRLCKDVSEISKQQCSTKSEMLATINSVNTDANWAKHQGF